jgi:hypothetical protein
MRKETAVCDRCRKEYDQYKFPQIRFKKKTFRVVMTKIFNPDPYAYVTRDYDLCPECATAFDRWMKEARHPKADKPCGCPEDCAECPQPEA